MNADVEAALDEITRRQWLAITNHIAEQDAEIERLKEEIQSNANDTERIQWVENQVAEGSCPGLFNDDHGNWSYTDDGFQQACEKPEAATFFSDPESWHPSIRECIDAAMLANAVEAAGVER